jgi:uncharacterized membrane-anchored protein
VYDPDRHAASFAVRAHHGSEDLVNARTRLLGRAGYLTFSQVTSAADFARDRDLVDQILAGCAFAPGERYEDFSPDSDPVASGGLADLVSLRVRRALVR